MRGSMDLPAIFSAKYSPVLAMLCGISSQSSISVMASIGMPAATLPRTGMRIPLVGEDGLSVLSSIRSVRRIEKKVHILSILSMRGIL